MSSRSPRAGSSVSPLSRRVLRAASEDATVSTDVTRPSPWATRPKRVISLALLVVALSGCGGGGNIERALEQEIPSDVDVVPNTCLRDGKTAQGHEHWTCLLHYPKTALTDDIYRRWDVAVDDGEIVAASPQQ